MAHLNSNSGSSGSTDILLTQVAEPGRVSESKVTVVGIGQVGMAAAYSILNQVSFNDCRIWFLKLIS